MKTYSQETKTHMVTINGRTVFVKFDASIKSPTLNGEDLERIFGVKTGDCIIVGR